ncbi:MAG: respiratory-chain dehydrogenase subunit 1 [Firmicutes bacterium]|nr:respiratory-chain dehydrogenase subunit 1 [Bacillota bacterium]
MVNNLISTYLIYLLGKALVLTALAPLVAGIIKKVKAFLQNRRGPGLFQLYFDIGKLLAKDSIISPTTSWIFTVTPFIYFAAAFGAAALAPVVAEVFFGTTGWQPDLFMLLYLFVLSRFFLVLAGLDAGSSFGGMGGAREMFVAVMVEPALLLASLTVALRAHSTNLTAMTLSAQTGFGGLSAIFAATAFFVVLIAETGRIPVDNPDTHLELTMIHEGMVLEYSGRRLGLIVWAVATKQLVLLVLFAALFWPFPLIIDSVAGQIVWLIVKVVLTAIALALTEMLANKMRLFKVPGFLAVASLLALLAIVAQ